MADEHSSQPAAQEGAVEQASGPIFSIKRVYVRDMSFEVPAGLAAFSLPGQPHVGQDVGSKVNKVNDTHYEVILNITVTIKMDEDKVAFLAEVQQAGLFEVSGLEESQLQHLLSTMCPQILFPYAREAIDNMATRGGFAPVSLPHMNFEALYAQAMEQAKTETKN